MSAAVSNLSDPKFSYDFVVAVTQKSINSTMEEFLDRASFKEVIGCFLKGAHKGDKPQPITYEQLKARTGTDPFAVPDDAGDDDRVRKLRDAQFMGAFRATIGLPPTGAIPPVVTLDKDDAATVTFNLLCCNFQITGFDYSGYWNNKSQPTNGKPWYFTAKVKLHSTVIDQNSAPADVRKEVEKRGLSAGTFSIQQMLLDLDTAADFSTLKFEGLDGTDPIAILINATFCKAYLDQMKSGGGHPILGYSLIVNQPDTSSFAVGALSREACPLLDPSNNPYENPTQDQQDAATFNYLCTAAKTPPTANRFTWNWVDETEAKHDKFDGVVALRRDPFLNLLQSTITQVMENHFCLTAKLDFSGDSNVGIRWDPTFGTGGKSTVTRKLVPTPVQSTDFTPFLQIDYNAPHQAQSPVRYWSDLNIHFYAYVMYNCRFSSTVDLAVRDKQQLIIRFKVHSILEAQYGHYEGAVWYTNLQVNNYLDYAATVETSLRIAENGQITVDTGAKPTDVKSNNPSYETSERGTLGMGTETVRWLDKHFKNHVLDVQKKNIVDCVANLAQEAAAGFENNRGWIFPGGKYFNFLDVGCSNFFDLITHIKYADVRPRR